MARIKTLVLFVSVLVLAAVVYWQGTFNAPAPARAPRAALELPPPAATTVNNVTRIGAAPSAVVVEPATVAVEPPTVPPAPSKDEASPAPVKKNTPRMATKKAPARAELRESPAVVTEHAETLPAVRELNVAPARATTYERRVVDAAAGGDADRALVELQRLAAAEPNRPEAYEAMAGLSLRRRDYVQARALIESALAHGGKATFTLIHDHNRGNFESDDAKATCVGQLTIHADEMKFEAPGEGDRFAANWSHVRDAGSNKFFGSGIGGFHVAINSGGKYRNVNFAPESKDKAEAKLILDLMTSYTRRADRTR